MTAYRERKIPVATHSYVLLGIIDLFIVSTCRPPPTDALESAVMRLAITGGTGYIGGRLLATAVEMGWIVCAVVHPEDTSQLPAEATRISDPGSAAELAKRFDDFGVEVVLHLAASQHLTDTAEASDSLVEANVAFGARVLSAAHISGARGAVLAGTFSTHATGTGDYAPQTLYAATKQALGDIAAYYNRSTSLTAVTLELSDNYGPGDTRPKFLKLLESAARSGEVLEATPGDQVMRPLHVDDIVQAFIRAAELVHSGEPLQEVYSVAGPEPVTVKELASRFAAATGTNPHVEWGRRPYRQNEIMVPFVATPLPGWKPSWSLDAGLAEVFGRKVSE